MVTLQLPVPICPVNGTSPTPRMCPLLLCLTSNCLLTRNHSTMRLQTALLTMLLTKKPMLRDNSYDEQIVFVQSLSTLANKPVCLSLFEETASTFVSKPKPVICSEIPLPASLDSVFKEENKVLESDKLKVMCNDFVSNYSLKPEECTSLKKATRQQPISLTWHIYRIGRITASKVYDVLRTSKTKTCTKLNCTNM